VHATDLRLPPHEYCSNETVTKEKEEENGNAEEVGN
jgi:hypothetical protein